MLLPALNGELIDRNVVQLDRAITGRDYNLVLIRFRPCSVVEGVLCLEPKCSNSLAPAPHLALVLLTKGTARNKTNKNDLPLLSLDAICSQPQNVKSTIAHQTKIGTGGNGYARVKKRRVLHGIAVEAFGLEF